MSEFIRALLLCVIQRSWRVPRENPTGFEASFATDLVTLAARWWTGWMLLVFYALEGVSGAWLHIWQEQPWSLLVAAAEQNVPSPVAVLATAFGLLCLACLGLLVGLFTRLCAFVVLGLLLGALYFLRADVHAVELVLIYLLGPVTTLVVGSGNWSLDATMGRRSRARR